jgi:hypothetical protein
MANVVKNWRIRYKSSFFIELALVIKLEISV